MMNYAVPKAEFFPSVRGRADRDADRRQPAGRQGRRRDGDDRLDAGGRERGHGRARAARDPAPRHAAHAGTRVAGDATGEGLGGGAMYTMRPAEFEYHRPTSLDEAISLLGEVEDSRPLAGGHSLLPMMKLRLAMPAALVDLAGSPASTDLGRMAGSRSERSPRTRGAGVRGGDRDRTGAPRDGGHDRRPAGAEPRHDGRERCPRRSGRRLPDRAEGARCDDHGDGEAAASARSQRMTSSVASSTRRSSPESSSPR